MPGHAYEEASFVGASLETNCDGGERADWLGGGSSEEETYPWGSQMMSRY